MIDFGVQGQTFPIVEENMIHYMKRSAKDFDLGKEVKEYCLHPTPVGLEKAMVKRSFTVALSCEPLPENLLFFDGGDERQVEWAKKETGIWILVAGSPIALGEREKREVYFDQGGFYTSTLNIENVPAKASQQGSEILVEEIPCF